MLSEIPCISLGQQKLTHERLRNRSQALVANRLVRRHSKESGVRRKSLGLGSSAILVTLASLHLVLRIPQHGF